MDWIPLSAPSLSEADAMAMADVIRSGWVSTASPVVREFEATFAQTVGAPYCAAMNSGTSALHLAMKALGLGPGDEVIVPALSFIASVNPVTYVGATPIFADVNRDTFGLTLESVQAVVSEQTKAIVVTHLFGFAAEVEAIVAWATDQGFWVIEDAAESLGTTVSTGQWTGSVGTVGCFSFNGNKTITTGSGGAVVSQEEALIRRIRSLSAQDRNLESPEIDHQSIGFNARMNALQAGLGLSQLRRLPGLLTKRRLLAERYAEALKVVPRASFCAGPSIGQTPSYWLSCLLLDNPAHRLPLIQFARERHIEMRPVFKPLYRLAPYQSYIQQTDAFPVTDSLWQQGVCLPSSADLTTDEQDRVIVCIQAFLSQAADV